MYDVLCGYWSTSEAQSLVHIINRPKRFASKYITNIEIFGFVLNEIQSKTSFTLYKNVLFIMNGTVLFFNFIFNFTL